MRTFLTSFCPLRSPFLNNPFGGNASHPLVSASLPLAAPSRGDPTRPAPSNGEGRAHGTRAGGSENNRTTRRELVLRCLHLPPCDVETLPGRRDSLSGGNTGRDVASAGSQSLPEGQSSSWRAHLPRNLTKKKRNGIRPSCVRAVEETPASSEVRTRAAHGSVRLQGKPRELPPCSRTASGRRGVW